MKPEVFAVVDAFERAYHSDLADWVLFKAQFQNAVPIPYPD